MFDKIFSQRLTALADHLETAETLKVGRFAFDVTFRNDGDGCQSLGCALGETSLLWPTDFKPVSPQACHYYAAAETFFGLTASEVEHLFAPSQQQTRLFGGNFLENKATRYEVAANIRAFLEVKGQQADAE